MVANLSTTAVIAHYNAAVELEHLTLWSEAAEEYKRAARLAEIGLKRQAPIH